MRYLLPICLSVLIAGCATKPEIQTVFVDTYCDKAELLLYRGVTKDFLLVNDPDFLRDVVAHNETKDRFCGDTE